MNNQDVRQHLRKGELAVAQLETLGFTYEVRKGWTAPELKPKHLSREEAVKALKELVEGLEVPAEKPIEGPNWNLVKDMVGHSFKVRPQNIPLTHPLREYNPLHHFAGKWFIAESIQYERSEHYTGYMVSFRFNLKPHSPSLVRLPLSCAAFQ